MIDKTRAGPVNRPTKRSQSYNTALADLSWLRPLHKMPANKRTNRNNKSKTNGLRK
jgi:hypothetical protein